MSKELTPSEVEAVVDALVAGQKILAIKLHREYSGEGLKEAKEYVEALETELRKKSPERFAQATGAGCATMFLVLLAVSVLAGVAVSV